MQATGIALPSAYAGYTSLYDLILEALLAFGMVTVVMEDVNRELQAANEELRVAHDAMQNLARVDPLTEMRPSSATCWPSGFATLQVQRPLTQQP